MTWIHWIPPHNLRLKNSSSNILLQNLYKPKLCNVTQIVIKKKNHGKCFKVIILIDKFQCEVVLLPQIPMMSSDSPFQFNSLQLFPICLATTLNKVTKPNCINLLIRFIKSMFLTWPIYDCIFSYWKIIVFVHIYGLTKNIDHQIILW